MHKVDPTQTVVKAYYRKYCIPRNVMAKIIAIVNKTQDYTRAFECFARNYRKSKDPERLMKKCITRCRLSYSTWRVVLEPRIRDCCPSDRKPHSSCSSSSPSSSSSLSCSSDWSDKEVPVRVRPQAPPEAHPRGDSIYIAVILVLFVLLVLSIVYMAVLHGRSTSAVER